MKILDKQQRLIKVETLLPYGIYNDLINDVNTSFYDKQQFSLRRKTERKTWIFFGFYSKEITCGFAIVDAGIAATAFSYIFIPEENIFVEDKTTIPFGFDSDFNPNLYDTWVLKNYSIHSDQSRMFLETTNKKYELNIRANNNDNGFSVVAPSKEKRPFNFTYKNLMIDSEVEIKYKGKSYHAKGNFGAIDFTKGYPPRETMWNWLSFIGKTTSGKTIAANIVDNFNDNMENILYVDGIKTVLSKANFLYKKPMDKNVWKINTLDNLLHLEVHPLGKRSEDLNLMFMKSKFTQIFGEIKGDVRIDGKLENFTAVGVTEEHFALW